MLPPIPRKLLSFFQCDTSSVHCFVAGRRRRESLVPRAIHLYSRSWPLGSIHRSVVKIVVFIYPLVFSYRNGCVPLSLLYIYFLPHASSARGSRHEMDTFCVGEREAKSLSGNIPENLLTFAGTESRASHGRNSWRRQQRIFNNLRLN